MASSGASPDSDFDEFVIESSSSAGISILTGASNSGGIMFGDSGDNGRGKLYYDHNADAMKIAAGGTVGLTLSSSQDTYLAGAIYLEGETASANKFDDYEEGAWTPVLIGAGGGTKTADTGNLGRYTKIGNLCTISGTIKWDSSDTLTGIVCISGIPFNTASVTHHRSGGVVGNTSGMTFPSTTYDTQYALGTDQARSNIYVFALGENSYGNPVIADAGAMYGFTITYQTD